MINSPKMKEFHLSASMAPNQKLKPRTVRVVVFPDNYWTVNDIDKTHRIWMEKPISLFRSLLMSRRANAFLFTKKYFPALVVVNQEEYLDTDLMSISAQLSMYFSGDGIDNAFDLMEEISNKLEEVIKGF